jgi:hypothetical protein
MLPSVRWAAVLGAVGALLLTQANAASLQLSTLTPVTSVGQVLTVTVQGREFLEQTYGGDFKLNFDANALQFVSLVASDPPFDTSSIDTSSSGSGLINRVDVFRFAGGPVGPDFDVATLTFNVLAGIGTGTTLQLGSSLVGWFDPDAVNSYAVAYGGLSVTTGVPLPAALWLFVPALALLPRRRSPVVAQMPVYMSPGAKIFTDGK